MKNGKPIFKQIIFILLLLVGMAVLCCCGHHQHVFGKWTPDDETFHFRTCKNCSEKEVEKHSFEAAVIREPTCKGAGIICYTCSVCGYYYDEEISPDPEAHQWSSAKTVKKSTCTEDGLIEYRCTVSGCLATKTETIPANGHDYGTFLSAIDSTCTEEGTIAHYHCAKCGQNFNESKEVLEEIAVPALGHTFGEWIPVQAATCTQPGIKGHYTCSVCQGNFDQYHRPMTVTESSLLPHRLILVEAVEDTCLQDGRVAHYLCEICEGLFSDSSGTQTVRAEDTIIPKGRHLVTEGWLTDGEKHWKECEICREQFDLGSHDFDEGNITVDATVEHDGTLTFACRGCGYEKHEYFAYDGKTKIRIAYRFNGMEPALRSVDNYTIGYVELTGEDITVQLPDISKATFPEKGYLASWSIGKHVYSPDTKTLILSAGDLSDGQVIKIVANINRAVSVIDFENKKVGDKPVSSEYGQEVCEFADFSRSGSGIPSVFTNEYDHTTGTGISLRTELDQVWIRQKYYNIFDRLLTNEDIGRQITVTFWLRSNAAVALQYGLMCPANTEPDSDSIPEYGFVDTTTTIYNPTLSYVVLEPNVWQEVTLSFTVDEYMIGSTCGELPRMVSGNLKFFYYNPSLLAIIIDRDRSHWTTDYPFTGPSGKSEAEEPIYLYVDDITVIETGKLDVGTHTWDLGRVTKPATPDENGTKEYTCTVCGIVRTVSYVFDPVVNTMDFDNRIPGSILSNSKTEKEVTTMAECANTNTTPTSMVITDQFDHTTGEGNSVSIYYDTAHVILKLYNVFDHVLTTADLGKTYRISFWVRTDSGSISLNAGMMSPPAWSMVDNPPEGWQSYAETIYPPTKTPIEADSEWRQYSFEVVITEIMLSDTFGALQRTRNGVVNMEYQNPALLGFTVRQFPGKVTLYLDDIVTTYIGEHTVHVFDEGTIVKSAKPGEDGEKLHTCLLCGLTEIRPYSFDPTVNVIDFEGFDNGKILPNVQTGPEVLPELSTAITDSGRKLTITNAEDHTTGEGKSASILIDSGSRNPKVKLYNVFDHILTEEDVGSIYRITCWVKTNNASGMTMYFGLLGPSAWDTVDNPPAHYVSYWADFYQPNDGSTATLNANGEWQMVSIDVEITEQMLSTYYGCLDRTRNGTTYHEYHNPALFSFKVSYNGDCTVYIDDIVTTYVGKAD